LAIKENRKYLNGVEFMVVCDVFHTSTTEETDVLIPSPSYLEQAGSFTRCDGTVQQSAKIITGRIILKIGRLLQISPHYLLKDLNINHLKKF